MLVSYECMAMEACGSHDNGVSVRKQWFPDHGPSVLPSILVYSTQKLHIMPEEEIPKKMRRGGI